MDNRKIRVAITHGDTNGIGYELILKAFEDQTMLDLCVPIIYGSPKVATYHKNVLDVETNFSVIKQAQDAREGYVNLLTVFEEETKVGFGVPTEESGNAALKAIDRALADYREGLFDVLVTAPLENNEAFHFSGQSRYIEDHLDALGKGMTIFVCDQLRVALATRNLPLKQVAESVTKESIVEKATLFHTSLRRDFRISSPRIAVLALNPKAGENGLLGTEEQDILAPAIDELAQNDIQVFGPYAADSFFGDALYPEFDGVLAMYYDQGIMPFRGISDNNGVNYTAGLPVVRTAPAHGARFDIAGKDVADCNAFRQAIYTAIDVFRHRGEYDQPFANPLRKLYKEKRDDSEKVRFAIPKAPAKPGE